LIEPETASLNSGSIIFFFQWSFRTTTKLLQTIEEATMPIFKIQNRVAGLKSLTGALLLLLFFHSFLNAQTPEVSQSWLNEVRQNMLEMQNGIQVNNATLPGTPDWAVSSSQQDALFGQSVANAGDVNLDGRDDVLVGAPHYSNGQTREGAVYVYMGQSGGLSTIPSIILESNIAQANMGKSVACAGDMNKDGYSDIIVGAPGAGKAFVYYGRDNGISSIPDITIEKASGDGFGMSVSTAGDVNGDGYSDIIIGAPHHGSKQEGGAYLYYGDSFGLKSAIWFKSFAGNSLFDGAYFGRNVSNAGDVNNDGYDDILVGAILYQSDRGDAFLFYGSANGPSQNWDWSAPWSGSHAEGAYFGSVSAAGDINGDGYDDIIIGAEHYDVHNGAAFVWYGHSWGLSQSNPEWTFVCEQNNAFLGRSVSTAGDVNGDGFDDIVIGARGYGSGQDREGKVYVFYGSPAGLSSTPGWTYESNITSAYTGASVSTAGDVNGDGFDDIIAGAPSYVSPVSLHPVTYGRAFAFYGAQGGGFVEERFKFNDGTVQNWVLTGAWNEHKNGPYSHQFSELDWWDRVNYPNGPNADPVGDSKGSMVFSNMGWTVDIPNGDWCLMDLSSPYLDSFSEWQKAKGATVEIYRLSTGDIYAEMHVYIRDNDQGFERSYSLDRVALQDNSWNHLTFDWSAEPGFPSDHEVRYINITIWFKKGDWVEGGIWLDDILPMEGSSILPPPSNLVVLNGYHYAIPIAWEAPSGTAGSEFVNMDSELNVELNNIPQDPINRIGTPTNSSIPGEKIQKSQATLLGYNIYRSTTQPAGYTKIASQVQRQYYRDNPPFNDLWYYYKVTAVYDAGESNPIQGFGKAQEGGYTIQAGWASSTPTLDGVINTNEWSNATTATIIYPGQSGTVNLYAMNNGSKLFMAVDDQRDQSLNANDTFAIFFDDNHNREWPPSSPSGEGLLQLHWSSGTAQNRFLPFYGIWPSNYGGESWATPSGVSQGISGSSGHVQYEGSFDLSTGPINASPGDEIGILAYAWEGGTSDFDGVWPQETTQLTPMTTGYGWSHAPFSYGDLKLSTAPNAEVPIFPSAGSPQFAGNEFWIDLKVGNNANPVSDLLGVSFNLHFTNTQYLDVVTPHSSNVIPGSFIGSDVLIFQTVDESSGKVSIGITRKSGQGGVSGSGSVARIKFIANQNTPNNTQVSLTFSEVTANNPTGVSIPLNPAASDITIKSGLTVWPGDTDNSGLVNQADVLPLGLHWDKTGPVRQNALNSWTGQFCSPWSPENATYADANGDGTVNQADVLPMGINWNKSHSLLFAKGKPDFPQTLNKIATTPNLTIVIDGEANPDEDFYIDIYANEVSNLFGFSFELVYTSTPSIDPLSVEQGTNNLLGNDLIFFPNINKNAGVDSGKVSVGISRKAGQGGVDGSGLVTRIVAHMSPNAVIGQSTSILSIQSVQANDPEGIPIAFDITNATDFALVTDVGTASNQTPTAFALHQNYPNPFNPETRIKYAVSKHARVVLRVMNLLGQEVRTLVNEDKPIGFYEVTWDGKDHHGQRVASGIYLYRLESSEFVQIRKMVVLQ
jgi:hypothetical protein